MRKKMRHIFRPLAQHGSKYNIVYYLHISCTVQRVFLTYYLLMSSCTLLRHLSLIPLKSPDECDVIRRTQERILTYTL